MSPRSTLIVAVVLAGLVFPARFSHSQAPAERTAFDAAVRSLQAGFAEKAAADFAAFRTQNPTSPLVPDAVLFEARSRIELGQLDPATRLLQERLESIGSLKDQALHTLGEIQLRRFDFHAAASAFHRLILETPNSELILKASFGEALAWFRAGAYSNTVALLSGPTNAFTLAAAAKPADELSVRGLLLLAEAQIRAGDTKVAGESLARLTNRPLSPVQSWEQRYLVTSLLLTNRESNEAVASSSNLLSLATAAASPALRARSFVALAEALTQAGRTSEAFDALTNNLSETTLPEWRRDAILALAQMPLDPSRIDVAIRLFQPLTQSTSNDLASAASRLAVAELRLQQHFSGAAPTTNTLHLTEARVLLSHVATNAPSPIVAGRAWYGLGWCELAIDQVQPALAAFQQAAQLLPVSTAQALALFKWADCQVLTSQHAPALTNYLRVIRDYAGSPVIRGSLRERALYQGALSALEAGQKDLATDLAGRAVLEFPDGAFRDETRVLYGQALARLDPPNRARDLLRQLSTRLVDSPALPDLQLAVARSYLRERNWAPALQQLDEWTRTHSTHPGLARAEYERAWAAFKAGEDVKAYSLYTNFLARFPDDPAAPHAQVWIADHLYRSGDFAAAEGSYQLIFQRTNWPVSRLTFEARLMAGRAAFARQGYKDAKAYFRWLIANGPSAVTNSLVPPELVARAYFALGDAFLLDPESDDKLTDAMNAFVYVIEKFPDSRESLLAQGKLANCHLQRAELDPTQAVPAYTEAARLYLGILKTPNTDVPTRSQSEVGLALVREKQAIRAAGTDADTLRKEALDRLLSVFHGGNLRPGEAASPFWLNRAGIEAARLAENLGLREQSAALYDALAKTFPTSATAFRQRAQQLRSTR